jgi:hypothetical protein
LGGDVTLEYPLTRDARSDCTEGDCPQVFDDLDPALAVVQGYEVTDRETLDRAAPPAGERLVRVPRRLLIDQGRRLEVAELFAAATTSVFRLETRPQYVVPHEEERLRAFREGRPLPPRNTPWLAMVARSVAAGVRWQRVHTVAYPLTEYLRFALRAYEENARAGEDVRIADQALHSGLAALTQDFWLIDAGTPAAAAILLRYNPEGRSEGVEISRDRDILARCMGQRDLALAHTVPFTDFPVHAGEPARLTRAG